MDKNINVQRDEIMIRFMSVKRFLMKKTKEFNQIKKNSLFSNLTKNSDYLRGKLDAYNEILEKFDMMTIEEKIRRAR